MKTSLLILSALLLRFSSYAQIVTVFDGTDFGPNLIPRSWGQSTMEIDPGTGPNGTNAIKWVQGNEYGNGWTGIQFSFTQPLNLVDAWTIANLTLTMKCESGVDSLRIQFVSPAGKIGTVFHPAADNQWHKYSFPLQELRYTEQSTSFDRSSINTIDLMAEADAVAGKIAYVTKWFVATEPSLVLFNGIAVPSNLDLGTWGATCVDVETGAGPVNGRNALHWIQGAGATGFRFSLASALDLTEVWDGDSLKFKMKAELPVDTVTVMLFSTAEPNAVGVSFVPVADNQWHLYAFALQALAPLHGTTPFDPSDIRSAEVQTANGKAGKGANIADFWTGNPYLDRVPPAAPSDLCFSPDSYSTLLMWTDVPGETGERYNVFYSENPVTDISKAEVVKLNIREDVQEVKHYLFAPAVDQEVSYYYAITCTDAAGNVSPLATVDPAVNTARGIPVISLHGPGASFVADGNLSEWAGVTPFHRKPSDGSQYVVSSGQTFSGDGDLTFDAYIAVDSANLYVAFDVVDDVVSYGASGTSDQDSPDFHIGLYNWHGTPHTYLKRGSHPDYSLRFAKRKAFIDLVSQGDSLLIPGDNYYWGKNSPSGYRIEARIPWTMLAAKLGDDVFVPVEGYRIPLDIMVNDADVSGTRESMLELSPFSDGHSGVDPSAWVYTWIGTQWNPGTGVEKYQNVPEAYSLAQNYPNPFNPLTTIKYTIAGTEGRGSGVSRTMLVVYDVLGRQVATLVNEDKAPGSYEARFDARGLSSGVYIYRLTAGSYVESRKMILVK